MKIIKIKLKNGDVKKVSKKRIKYAVYRRLNGKKILGTLATRDGIFDESQIQNIQEVCDEVINYFRSRK